MWAKIRNNLFAFVVFSFLFHLSLVGVLNLRLAPKTLENETIEIEIIDSRAQKLQLIEQDKKALNDEVPEETKYLGRHNQRVIEETKAAVHGDYRNSDGKGQNPLHQKNASTPQKTGQKKLAEGNLPSLSALSPKFNISQHQSEESPQNTSEGLVSQQNDHLKDVQPSIQTMLNSKEFVYYTYYQRIRDKIRQHWEPSIRDKVRKIFAQGRSIASTQDHITRVIIILNNAGELIKVNVIGRSGVLDLDEAAVEAFRAAEPFPNPPKGIIDPDGTIKINWDFILEA